MKKKRASGNPLRANTLLGQHFLSSDKIADEIVSASNIIPGDIVLEIGPGKGILTRALLRAGARVVAVEKDARFADMLSEEFGNDKRITIVCSDILSIDRTSLGITNGTYKVVANIPYYITAKITRAFLEDGPRPRSMTLMVQHEVAKRMTASPPDMNMLALSIQTYGTPRIVKKVPRSFFRPQPNVDSAIITITNISNAFFENHSIDPKRLFTRARSAFAQKRKTLKNSIGIDSKKRPQELSLEDWATIASPQPIG